MQTNLSLSLGLLIALTIGASAQTNNFQPNLAPIVPDRSSGVNASVIANTASLEQTAFDLLNQKRIENGLQALDWNDRLASIARSHSQNMAEFHFFSHRGLDDKMVSDRAEDAGVGGWRAIGENIAFNRGYQDPIRKAVDLWLNS